MRRNKEGENPASLSQSAEQKTTYRRNLAPKPMDDSFDPSLMQQAELGKAPMQGLAMRAYLEGPGRAPMQGVGLVPLGNPMAAMLPGAPGLVQTYVLLLRTISC